MIISLIIISIVVILFVLSAVTGVLRFIANIILDFWYNHIVKRPRPASTKMDGSADILKKFTSKMEDCASTLGNTSQSSSSKNSSKKKKIISDQEGEYVDFEEVNKDSTE